MRPRILDLLTTAAVAALLAGPAAAQTATSSTMDTAQMSGACTVSWKVIDTDGNGKISQSEAQAFDDAEFNRIDVNDDGIISSREWQVCAAPNMGSAMQSAEATGSAQDASNQAAKATNSAQGSGSGSASASAGSQTSPASSQTPSSDMKFPYGGDQAAGATGSTQDSGSASAPASAGSQTPPASDQTASSDMDRPDGGIRDEADWTEESFATLDADKSGDISPEEAAKAGEKASEIEGKQASQEAMISGWRFAAVDDDGDGKITEQEWQNRHSATIDARFNKLDKDGNGELTQSEFKAYRNQRFSEAQQSLGGEPRVWVYYYYLL